MLSTAGLAALTWAIIEAAERGWTGRVPLAGFGVALVALAAFVGLGAPHRQSPMLDVRLFRVGRFSGASVSIALVFFSLFGAIFFLTMYLQEVKDYDALRRRPARSPPVALGLVLGGPAVGQARRAHRHSRGRGRGADDRRRGAVPDVGRGRRHGYGLIAASLVLIGLRHGQRRWRRPRSRS